MSLPRIAVTTGDPAGIGPEVCLKLLANPEVLEICQPIIFGDASVLNKAAEECGLPRPEKVVHRLEEATEACVLDFKKIAANDYMTGCINAATGHAGYHYVIEAIDAALAKNVDAVTTGPLNKEALRMADVPFPGHTEIFADRTQSERACMLQYSEEVRCVFVTTHVGYAEVPPFSLRNALSMLSNSLLKQWNASEKGNQDCSAADSIPMLARTASLVTERKNKSSYPPLKKSESAAST